MAENPFQLPNHGRSRVTRFDVLPDDVLLEIFDFYVDMSPWYEGKTGVEEWQTLVHVCRRWRTLVFGSPRRLTLVLYCTPETPARDTLDVWPALPLIVRGNMFSSTTTDNITAALEQHDRVHQILLREIAGWQLEEVSAAMMQVPFPELRYVNFWRAWPGDKMAPVIPDSFLDGSAPRLRHFELFGIPFPGLPKLYLSAPHLVYLKLRNIPHPGHISPEAIVALISELSSLETLILEFESPLSSRPGHETPPSSPSKRFVNSALTLLQFQGVIEYLERLVTGIDTPQLDKLYIIFFNQIDFDTPQLAQFINRTPKLGKRDATVEFDNNFARVRLSPGTLAIETLCRESDLQLSSVERVCNSSLHPLSTVVEDLYIERRGHLDWENYAIEITLRLQLLFPFTTVKNLYISKTFAPSIAAALQELIGGRITEVLPSLQNIFVEGLEPSGPVQEKIGQFVAARQLPGSDHIITISDWDRPRIRLK